MEEKKTIEEIITLTENLNCNYLFAFEIDGTAFKGANGKRIDLLNLLAEMIYRISNRDFEKSTEVLKFIADLILLLDIDNM